GGFIGSLFLQMICLKSPEKVAVCELNTKKHRLLNKLGASTLYSNISKIDDTFDLVIECVGKPATSEAAVASAKKGANILLFGVPTPEAKLSLPGFDIYRKELKIIGSFINPYTLRDAVSVINQNHIQIKPLLSHIIPLEEVAEVLENFQEKGITKAVVKVH